MEYIRVDREYLDEALRRLAVEPNYRPADWGDGDVRAFRRLVQCASAAVAETDLTNMRSLDIRPADRADPARARATLSSGRQIDILFKTADNHGVVVLGLLPRETDTPE